MSKWLNANPQLEQPKKRTFHKRNVTLALLLSAVYIMLCFYTPLYLYNYEASVFYSGGLLLMIFPPVVLLFKKSKKQLAHIALSMMGITLLIVSYQEQHYLPVWSFVYIYSAMFLYGNPKGLLLTITYYLVILLLSPGWLGAPFEGDDYIYFTSIALLSASIAYFFEFLRCKILAGLTTPAKEAEKINIKDPLTGLYNRLHFDNFFNNEMNTAKQANTLLAFAILDVDYFKPFKKTYGRQAADQVLISISALLKSKLRRASDTVFRMSDNQFALLFTVKNASEALLMIEAIRNAVEQLQIQHANSEISHFLTISCGLEVISAEHAINDQLAYKICSAHLVKAQDRGHNQTASDVV
ncbi:GGDEF domain-containing protein [Psychromonas sp.]|uniref:GGDEF domain-containing protein n=1 Tax=Psychromonas sp. TaxID=1884585 RepID=UPI00356704B0